MTSRQHQDWINHGRPNSGLARPLAQLRDLLRAAGWLVYDYPNDAHLDAEPPEDHTFYSETGWPGTSPKWWMHAIDIMPDGKGATALTALGAQIFADRNAGRITWLKYMNWPSDGNLNHAVQDSWKPDHRRGSSTDAGHIHLSCITGVETLDAPYNPFLEGKVSKTIDDVYNLLAGIINGDQKPNGTPSQVPDWVVKGAKQAELLALTSKVDTALEKLAELATDVAALKAQNNVTTTGDVQVTGTLHLG